MILKCAMSSRSIEPKGENIYISCIQVNIAKKNYQGYMTKGKGIYIVKEF